MNDGQLVLPFHPTERILFLKGPCVYPLYELQRETRDLDFLIKDLTEVSGITLADGFTFENLDVGPLSHTHMKYPGHQVSVIGKLGNTKTKIFIDIDVGDAVRPTEITMKLLGTDKSPLFEKEIHLCGLSR